MFKLVVLSALLALAAAKPSYLHSALLAPAVYAAPAAVSHQSRVDVHSSPVLAYSAPVVAAHAPVYSAYAAPVHSAWSSPLALGPYTPATVLSPHGVPLETAEVVAAKAIHYQAHALANHGVHHYIRKRSAYPLAYTALVAPSAVSHQSRVDVHSAPVLSYPLHYSPSPLHYSPAPLHYSPTPLHYSSPLSLWAPHPHTLHAW